MLLKCLVAAAIIALLVNIYIALVNFGVSNKLNKALKLTEDIHNDDQASIESLKAQLRQVNQLNRMLCTLLFDLLNSECKQELRWKFHVLKRVERLFNETYGAHKVEDYYDKLKVILLDAPKHDRERLFHEIELETADYFLFDEGEREPILKLLRDVVDQSDNLDKRYIADRNARNDFIAAAEALFKNFQILDTNPLGDVPNSSNAKALEDTKDLSREEMLDRLILMSRQLDADDYTPDPVLDDEDKEEEAQDLGVSVVDDAVCVGGEI